ncbi:MAG: ATP-binding protein [Alphaproteobacteria bacterium]
MSHLRETDKRKDREDKLVEKDAWLKGVVDNVSEMIITIDERGAITSFNPAAERAFGYAAQDVIGKNVSMLMPEPHRSAHDLYLDNYLRTGTRKIIGTSGRVLEARRQNGTRFPIELFVTEMWLRGKRQFIGAVRDVSDRLAHESALEAAIEQANAANQAKSLFLANMSHELRTPLNAVIGFSDIMNQELFGPIGNATYCEYAKDIHASGTHLLQLINDILDIAKINSGKAMLCDDTVDIQDAIDAALRLIDDRARAGGLTVGTRLDPSLPTLLADETKVRQVLLNILTNAVKFTPPGGSVTVEASVTEDGELAVRITDTGIGIAPEEMQTVLEPFGQVDSSFTRKQQGTGLGIPLTKKLVELHGGRLEIESSKGIGTRVSAYFPAERLIRDAGPPTGHRAAA